MQALDKPIHRIPNSTTHNSSKKQEYDSEQKKCIRITNKCTGWAMHVCCCLQCLAHAFVLPSSLRVLRRRTSSALPGHADPAPPRRAPAASPLPAWRRGWSKCSPPPPLLPLRGPSSPRPAPDLQKKLRCEADQRERERERVATSPYLVVEDAVIATNLRVYEHMWEKRESKRAG
jgi:hypothetical protein